MNNDHALGELVTIDSALGFKLDGILYKNGANRTTVIHIHGSFGNFFHNRFIRFMAARYNSAGINLLSFNLSCHDGFSEGFRADDELEYVGGAITDFSTCIPDIEGAIKFVSRFSDRIVLQGHSLGCDRVLHFLVSRDISCDFILLAPCDSYKLHSNWIAPETVEDQIKRLMAESTPGGEFGWLPIREYGIRQGDWVYPIPITRKALLSIIDGPPFHLIRIESPAKFYLDQESLIYIGGEDAIQVYPADVMFKYFEGRIRKVIPVYIANGDHDLGGCEMDVIERVIKWISR